MERREFLKATGLAAGGLCLDGPARADERAVAIRARADRPCS